MKTVRTKKEEEAILIDVRSFFTPLYTLPFCDPAHDITHIERMLAIAEEIYSDSSIPKKRGPVSRFLLKVAIWAHNLDRSSEAKRRGITIRSFLKNLPVTKIEKKFLFGAVNRHDQLNSPKDSLLLQHLMDCDRLDMGAVGIFRIGAVAGAEGYPLYTKKDFKKGRRSTKGDDITSALHDLQACIEWEEMLRIPKAKEIGKPVFLTLKVFHTALMNNLRWLGQNS